MALTKPKSDFVWTDESMDAHKKLNMALLSVSWMFTVAMTKVLSSLYYTNVVDEISRCAGLLRIKPVLFFTLMVYPPPTDFKKYIALHAVASRGTKCIVCDLRQLNSIQSSIFQGYQYAVQVVFGVLLRFRTSGCFHKFIKECEEIMKLCWPSCDTAWKVVYPYIM